MEKKSAFWLIAYSILSAVVIVAEVLPREILIYCTKPLLMPALAIWLVQRTPGIRRFLRQTLLAGLLFSMLGDTFLMFGSGPYGTLFFLLGLGSFLCTHLCYLGGFFSEVRPEKGFLRRHPYWILPFLIFLLAFLAWLWPGIPAGLQWPVVAYAGIISLMALSVLNMRGQHVVPFVLNGMLAGALLFMFSDCLIAVIRFGQGFPGARPAILLTYLLGQWLIIRGGSQILRRFPDKKPAAATLPA